MTNEFHMTGNRKEDARKSRRLGVLHAYDDVKEKEKRPHSIDATKEYKETYEKAHSRAMKEHEQSHWGKGK